MIRETEYQETIEDYKRYYSSCVFYKKTGDGYYVTKDSYYFFDGDEDPLYLHRDDISDTDIICDGILADVYDNNRNILQKNIYIKSNQFDFTRKLHTYYINKKGGLISISHENTHTYKKGMDYINDYSISPLYGTPAIGDVLNGLISSKPRISKRIKKDIHNLILGKIHYVFLGGLYVAVKHKQFTCPVIYAKNQIVGIIPEGKVKIYTNGKIANRLNKLYG